MNVLGRTSDVNIVAHVLVIRNIFQCETRLFYGNEKFVLVNHSVSDIYTNQILKETNLKKKKNHLGVPIRLLQMTL